MCGSQSHGGTRNWRDDLGTLVSVFLAMAGLAVIGTLVGLLIGTFLS